MPRALSTNVGAIRQRAARAAAKSSATADGVDMSSEPIGVTGESNPPPTPATKPGPLYYCLGCRWTLAPGMTPCPGCGEELVWPEDNNA